MLWLEALTVTSKVAKMNNNKALVVEGGAMRGIFATGVLDAFIEANYQPFNQCYGVSAGATNIAAYLCAQYKRNHAVITDYSCRPEFIDFVRFIKGGHLFDLDWLWQETIRDIRLDLDTFKKQASEFYIVTTNIQTGQAEYLKASAAHLEEQLKASCALPIAYREFPIIDNLQLTDGGVADSIPIRKAYEMGNKEITVILSQPLGYKKKPAKAPWLVKRLYKRTPALAEATLRRAENYNQSIDFITNPPSDCKINIIAPPPNFAVGRTTKSFEKLSAGYEMGLNAGAHFLTQVA